MFTISVIVPCLDIKRTINGCMNSINNQKYTFLKTNIEVICVIDGNIKDLEYIKKWQKKNMNNLKFELKIIFLNQNNGAGFARNIGYQNSKGDFITFLDDDDIWADTKIEEQLNWHIKNPKKILSTHYYSNGNDYVNKRMRKIKEITFKDLLIGGVRVATPTIMIRKSIWDHHPEKMRYCEDWLMVSMIASNQNIYIIPKLLAYRSKEALPRNKDKLSLSNQKLKLRFGKVKCLFILYKRGKIDLLKLSALIIFQIILFLRSPFNSIFRHIRI